MSLNYNTFVSELANMVPISSGDGNFQTMLPGSIDYAENRIYRELDLLFTQVTDSTTLTSSGNRNFNLPTSAGTFITADQINLITPPGTMAVNGTRVPLLAVSPEVVDGTYRSNAAVGQPKYYAMRSNSLVILGPAPDYAYVLEVIGIQRPTPLSSANSSTILTQYVPDLFFAAAMVFVSAYMRNFGAQSDDPQMSQSWENQYRTLFQSAAVEQARAKFHAEGWTSEQPSPIASPPRV
jgi:hypothetical protein